LRGQDASAAAVLDTGARIAHAVHEDSTYVAIHRAWLSAVPWQERLRLRASL